MHAENMQIQEDIKTKVENSMLPELIKEFLINFVKTTLTLEHIYFFNSKKVKTANDATNQSAK